MGRRRLRLGIRAQLTLTLLLGALLSTVATLFIANNAIQQYALQQTHTQEQQNMKIALLVLQTQYGQNVSISSDNQLVTDTPSAGQDFATTFSDNGGKYALNDKVDYVDQVQQLLGGFVSVYQCANPVGPTGSCTRISTTLRSASSASSTSPRELGGSLEADASKNMAINSATPQEWLGVETFNSQQYYTDYFPLLNPQQRLVGVLAVGVPLDTVTAFQRSTTIQLLLLGLIIMIAGVIFALLFAATITTTLQNVARQVIGASERISSIAAQQAGGSQQQVWAVNSINKALQNFAETTRDISHRTDQLAQMGNQVIQKRAEISPMQIDSILAYITRSVRDISAASRQEAQQYDRMTNAMQAVIEIAEQVAASSHDATDSAQRLDEVIDDLQRIVGVQRIRAATAAAQDQASSEMEPAMAGAMSDMGQIMSQPAMAARGMGGMAAAAQMPSDQNMRGGQYMGRMPGTAANLNGMYGMNGMNGGNGRPTGGNPSGALGQMPAMGGMPPMGGMPQPGMRPMGGMGGMSGGLGRGSSGALGPMGGGMGPMGGGMGRMGDSDRLPPLGPANNPADNYGMMNPVSGPMDGGPFGGRRSFGGDQGGEISLPMPPLPDFPTSGYGPSRPDVSAAPPARTRGIRGPVSGPHQGGQNGNGSPTRNRLPDWSANQDADSPYGRGHGE